jgi:diguanylate cyclase (GGDEF)-like protein/PAS domain S-box-containing protein
MLGIILISYFIFLANAYWNRWTMHSRLTKPYDINFHKPSVIILITLLVMSFSHFIDTQILGFSLSSLANTHYPLSIKSGLALVLVFYFSHKALIPIFVASLIDVISLNELELTSQLFLFHAFQGMALCLQSIVIYLSFDRSVNKGNPFSSSHNLITFIGITTFSALIVSFLMTLNLSSFTATQITSSTFISIFLTNLTSLITISSLFFAFLNHSSRIRQNTHPLEWLIGLSATVICIYFSIKLHSAFILISVPLFMWAATRFNQLTCSFTILIGSFLSAYFFNNSVLGYGLQDFPVFTPQLITLLLIISTLYFSSLRSDQRKIEFNLEEIVEQRTRDLVFANQELRDEVFNRELAEKSFHHSSSRYKALFETAGIPIIVLNAKFKIKQWNTAAEIQFSYTKEAVLGKNFIKLFIPESIQDETAWKFTKILESGMNKENMETEVLSYDGVRHTMLWNMNHFDDKFDPKNHKQLLLIGQNISEIRKTQDQLHYLAHYDPLTDTANRRLFEDRCEQAIHSSIRHKKQIALIGLDIDHFKRINDTLGHDVGDQFLIALANRLKECVRKEDTIARLGGDEFAILLASISGPEGAETVARNILDTIIQPIMIQGQELIVTSSIGITICPDDAKQYPDLLKNSDMAMYRAKNAGRNNIQFYSPEMNDEMQTQLRIEKELRSAIQLNEFKLYYQPIIDIETGEVLALEALLRWQHPEKGLIKPDYFIEIAEQTGQLTDIGKWVIKNACLQGRVIHQWSKSPIQIALNLSNKQFTHPRLVEMIKNICDETHFHPRNLILEMSESSITQNMDLSYLTLNSLSDLGVSLTIDGFGTGLSSLRQLKSIPINMIKIDRTFVKGIPGDESDMAITETLLAIATQMDLKTFAAGVETIEQEAFLKINGCKYAQGYLYTPPLPFKSLPELFAQIEAGHNLSEGNQIFLPFNEEPNAESLDSPTTNVFKLKH